MGSSADTELVLDAVAGCREGVGGWVRANCPMCVLRRGTRDRRASLGLHAPTGGWHCFRCGARGKVPVASPHSPVASFAGAGVRAGVRLQGRQPGAALGGSTAVCGGVGSAALPVEALHRPSGWLPLGEGAGATALAASPHRAYLGRRGVSAAVVAAAQVGCCLTGRWAGRVLVPVLGPGGAWLGWSGRALHSATVPRYRYPIGMDRASALWNAAALHVVTDEPLLIVEGVFDGLRHWPNVVAVLGKPSAAQLPALLTATRPLVVALDGDAWRDGEALAWRLQLAGARAAAVRLPAGQDPGSMTKGELSAQVGSCTWGQQRA